MHSTLLPHHTPGCNLRPARPSDRDAIAQVSIDTWGARDYMSRALDAWLVDTDGELYVAETDAGVVGTAKLTRHSPQEWWLEGVRVLPSWRRIGIGRALVDYGMARADAAQRELGEPGALRLCTEDHNPVRRMAHALGMVELGRFVRCTAQAEPDSGRADEFRQLSPADLDAVDAFLDRSAHDDRERRGTMGRPMRFAMLDRRRLGALLTRRQVFGWHGSSGDRASIDGVVIHDGIEHELATGDRVLTISYLDAIAGAVASLADAARSLTAILETPAASHAALASPGRIGDLTRAGWRPVSRASSAVLLGTAVGTGTGDRRGRRAR